MIDFQKVYKSYGSQDLLISATFRINRNEHVGIVGPNGAGKSTIFQIVTGEIEADKGEISIPDKVRIGYLHQHLLDAECSNNSVLEFVENAIPEASKIHHEIHELEKELEDSPKNSDVLLKRLGELQTEFESLGGYGLKTKAESALSGLGFEVDSFSSPFSTFSGGWQMRAAMAKVLISDPDILLLDEPSNYLDVPAIEWLKRFLKNFGGTLLLVSHDRFLLTSLTNITIEINAGMVSRYPGDYDYYTRARSERLRHMESAKKNQDKKKEQMERFIERFRSKNTKATLVQSQIKKLESMEDISLPDDLRFSGTIRIPDPPHCGADIITMENSGKTYDGENWIIRGVDFSIEKGTKTAFVGYNGTGKTTFIKMMADRHQLSEGRRILGHQVVIGYQAQEFSEILDPEKSVYDIVRGAAPNPDSAKNIRALLGSFGFRGDDIDKKCQVLSGGEKIRLCFARIFINPPNFLILDEPTTHLDISAREALQQALADYKGTVCLVSHDIEFIRNVADRIIEMSPPGIKKYFGNYEYYLGKKEQNSLATNTKKEEKKRKAAPTPKELRRERAARRQAMQKEKKEVESRVNKLETKIEKLEHEQSKISDKILSNSPDIDFAESNYRLQEIQKELTTANEEWEKAAEVLDEFMKKYSEIHNK